MKEQNEECEERILSDNGNGIFSGTLPVNHEYSPRKCLCRSWCINIKLVKNTNENRHNMYTIKLFMQSIRLTEETCTLKNKEEMFGSLVVTVTVVMVFSGYCGSINGVVIVVVVMGHGRV